MRSMDKTRVLIVEDQPDSVHVLKRLLAFADIHSPSVATTVAEAMASLADQDVILLDLRLPDGDGCEVLKRLREMGSPARVALLTADSNTPLLRETLALKPDMHMQKPIDFNVLLHW